VKNTHCGIKIHDPERWNLKYTEKRKHYIQLHGNFWSDSDFLALSSSQKVMFLWILNASLRVNSPSLSVCLESAKGVLKCSLDDAKGFLSELESFNIIGLQTRVRKTAKPQLIEKNRIEKNRSKCESKNDSRFDLEAIYDAYPKKVGKKNGMAKLEKLIKTEKVFREVLDGAKNYSDACKTAGTSKKYIKNFSTWVNGECWEDEISDGLETDTDIINFALKSIGLN
jgi:hypothetical protein